MSEMAEGSRIYVAGHRGLVGSAICRCLQRQGYTAVVVRDRADLDLSDPLAVRSFFDSERPDYVFLAAAKVGGIFANDTYPADFIHENLAIQLNVISASHLFGVKRLLFLGSSCIYPRLASQPIREGFFLSGSLEPTNRAYAVAKIAGIEMCWAYNRQYGTQYLAAMPANLYGPGDNFDLNTSHVLPALIRKIIEAKIAGTERVVVWGSGSPRREFLYSEDLGEACVFLMNLERRVFNSLLAQEEPPIINVGTGVDLTIRELAEGIARILQFDGTLTYDLSKPDGVPRKLLDVTRINQLGWAATTSLEEGIRRTCETATELLRSGNAPDQTVASKNR